jgi:hypothetical protein
MMFLQEGEEGGEKKGFLGLGGHKKVTIELLRLMILHTLDSDYGHVDSSCYRLMSRRMNDAGPANVSHFCVTRRC